MNISHGWYLMTQRIPTVGLLTMRSPLLETHVMYVVYCLEYFSILHEYLQGAGKNIQAH